MAWGLRSLGVRAAARAPILSEGPGFRPRPDARIWDRLGSMETEPPPTFQLAPASPLVPPLPPPAEAEFDEVEPLEEPSPPDAGEVPVSTPGDRIVAVGAVVPGAATVPAAARAILGAFHRWGLPPEATSLLAVAAAAIAASAFAMNHPGFGAVFALVAIGISWLSTLALTLRPGRYAPGAPHGFVEAMQPSAGALILGGLVLDAAQNGGPFAQLVTLALLTLEWWSFSITASTPRRTLLLGSPERLATLAVCALLGHPLFGAFAVMLLTAFEIAMPILRLWPGGSPLGPRLLATFGGSQGRLPIWVRAAAFGAPVLLALVLPAEFGWRF